MLSSKAHKIPIIVSLTSFPARINNLWLVIESMFRQTIQPDKIIVWLSVKQFPDIKSVPKNLLRLQERGLEIRLVPDDLRSHKKYIYAMTEYPESIVITIDDDIFYHSNTIQYLIDSHQAYPNDVIANIAHQLKYQSDGSLLPYNDWTHNIYEPNSTNRIFQVGVGGVLYPPHCAHSDICNAELAYKYCPYGDDIWLYAMCQLNGTSIRTSASSFVPLPIYNSHNQSLSSENLQGRNDEQIHRLIEFCLKNYHINPFEK